MHCTYNLMTSVSMRLFPALGDDIFLVVAGWLSLLSCPLSTETHWVSTEHFCSSADFGKYFSLPLVPLSLSTEDSAGLTSSLTTTKDNILAYDLVPRVFHVSLKLPSLF